MNSIPLYIHEECDALFIFSPGHVEWSEFVRAIADRYSMNVLPDLVRFESWDKVPTEQGQSVRMYTGPKNGTVPVTVFSTKVKLTCDNCGKVAALDYEHTRMLEKYAEAGWHFASMREHRGADDGSALAIINDTYYLADICTDCSKVVQCL